MPLAPDRPVGEVTREVLTAVGRVGGAVEINPRPQEVPWSVPLDEDFEHARYDPAQVGDYFAAAAQVALALAEFRAPYRGRSSPVNAWWGTFDLAVFLFSGLPADPPGDDFIMRNGADAQLFEVGWWPGMPATRRRRFSLSRTRRRPPSPTPAWPRPVLAGTRRWASTSWTGMTSAPPPDPRAAALEFARSAFRHACVVCGWDTALADSAEGRPPPIR